MTENPESNCILCALARNEFFNTRDHDLVEIALIDPTIKIDLCYAAENNFTGKKIYLSHVCLVRRIVAERLRLVQISLAKHGVGLKILDGYRPFSVQEIFWKLFPDPRYVVEPVRDVDGTPVTGSRHSRGVAVDLTLVDLCTGQELEMPSDFDDFSEKAHRCYDQMTVGAASSCQLLEDTMVIYGFEPLETEWWHFDLKGWEHFDLLDFKF